MSLSAKINEEDLPELKHSEFRFVHTADLHLDSPLSSLALRDEALADLVKSATRTTLIRIVDLCIEEQVHALLIAGDLFDRTQKSMHSAAVLTNQMRRLNELNIPVFMIRGNHDALSTITKQILLPNNVHVFDGRGGSISLMDGLVTIHGTSFSKPQAPESLLPKYKAPVRNSINIGMLHTSLAGSSGHDVYAPCSVNELDAFGYDYWALGHIHKRSEHQSKATIVMPGIPQGRDIGESGAKSVSHVTIDANNENNTDVKEHFLAPVQFEHVYVDVQDIETWDGLLDSIQHSLSNTREATQCDHVIARITVQGSSALSFRIKRDIDLLLSFAREQCNSIGNIWIEKCELKISTPIDINPDTSNNEVIPELRELIQDSVLNTPSVQMEALAEMRAIIPKLPAEFRTLFGEDEQQLQDIVNQYLEEGSQDLLDQLTLREEL